MNERQPLKMNTKLEFTNHDAGNMSYIITGVIGSGGTCIVYNAFYLDNTGARKTVRIKECYPIQIALTREDCSQRLDTDNEQMGKFDEYKQRIRMAFDIAGELFNANGLTNSVSNMLDIYDANNTIYIVSSYAEGNTMSQKKFGSLKQAVLSVLSTAKSIAKIHKKGYLYLDVKPENILVLDETTDMIQLFDFDCVIPCKLDDDISNYRLSYSMGYAPLEQKYGDLSKIGPWSDVYGIGALLFFVVFGRTPSAVDCGVGAVYDYSKIKYNKHYQDRLFAKMTQFFKHTLQSYIADRYQTVNEAIDILIQIADLADVTKPFIHSSFVPDNEIVIGRDCECKTLSQWYASSSNLFFVTGMGGIGKSTVVRRFIRENRDNIDTLVYIYYKDSVVDSICDDSQFAINVCEKGIEETTNEYFYRKIKLFKELSTDNKTLFVLDNYDGRIDDDFLVLLNLGVKVIAVTRVDESESGYDNLSVDRLDDRNELYELFISKLGYELDECDMPKLDSIIDLVKGHTLILELIAKQIAKSYLTMDEALTLSKENGFFAMAPEKIDYVKDGKRYHEKISGIIKAVYDVEVMSDIKKKILKNLSLFDMPGIDIRFIKKMIELESFDPVNELFDESWLIIMNGNVTLHPLVQETIHQMSWNDEYRSAAYSIMDGLAGEYETAKSKKIRKNHSLCTSVISNSRYDEVIPRSISYKNLTYKTVMNTPRDQEEYIIYYAGVLCHDNLYTDRCAIMELFDFTEYMYLQMKDYDAAQRTLDEAKAFARRHKDNHIWGLYYDMLGDYYDDILDGAYYCESMKEKMIFHKLMRTSDNAIKYMSKSSNKGAGKLLAKYILSKTNCMIRGLAGSGSEILELIGKAENILDKITDEFIDARMCLYLAYAWYYTLYEPNINFVLDNLNKARYIIENSNYSKLDEIDYYFIPAANMMCELDDIESSKKLLEEGISICDEHSDVAPYIRRKDDLLEYIESITED